MLLKSSPVLHPYIFFWHIHIYVYSTFFKLTKAGNRVHKEIVQSQMKTRWMKLMINVLDQCTVKKKLNVMGFMH